MIRFIDQGYRNLYEECVKKQLEAMEKHLRFFAGKKEADEWDLEQLAAFGISHDIATSSILNIGIEMELKEGLETREALSPSVCKKAYESHERDIGQTAAIRWNDTHHGTRFRAYNLSKEIIPHRYM